MSVLEHEIITDKEGIPASVGEKIRLMPAFVDNTWGNLKSVKWTIAGKYIKGYNAHQQTYVKVKPLPEGDKENCFIDFYWIDKGDGLKVEADCLYTKGRKPVKATFNVKRPKVDSFEAVVNQSGVGYYRMPPRISLGPGRGIVFKWSVSNDGASNGELKDLQLMVDERRMKEDNGRRWVYTMRGASPGERLLDNYNPYASTSGAPVWKAYGGTAAPWRLRGSAFHPGVEDSPCTGLPPTGVMPHPREANQRITIVEKSVKDDFRYYLMYKSEKPQSIWIPIARVDWHWSGVARFSQAKSDWEMVEQDWSRSPPVLKNQFIELPVWERAGGTEKGLSAWRRA